MRTEATREGVLAWMKETGKGPADAARHFGVPVGRVKMWKQRALVTATGGNGAKRAGEGARRADHKAVAQGRAHARVPVVEAMGPELRHDLRRGVAGIARFIAAAGDRVGVDGRPQQAGAADDAEGAEPFPDWQQVAHAARALQILLEKAPDIMTFNERTNPQTTEASARAAEIGGVFGSPPSSVTVLDGGRVAAKA